MRSWRDVGTIMRRNYFTYMYPIGKFSHDIPSPILAGGAIRDTLLSMTPDDFDFFVNTEENYEKCKKFFMQYDHFCITKEHGAGYAKNFNGVKKVAKLEGGNHAYRVDLILADFEDEKDLINMFDYTVNAVAMRVGSYGAIQHPYFKRDLRDMKLRPLDNGQEISEARQRKMQRKGFNL